MMYQKRSGGQIDRQRDEQVIEARRLIQEASQQHNVLSSLHEEQYRQNVKQVENTHSLRKRRTQNHDVRFERYVVMAVDYIQNISF